MSAPDPPNKCYCKFEKQHFLILADVFKDMSTKCSDHSFSDTLQRSSAVFANMATNCSESRALAPQAQSPARYGKAHAEVSANVESDAAMAALEAAPQAPQNSENLEAQFMRAIPVAKAESEARAAAKAESEAREVARAEAEANALERRAKAAAKTNAAPQKQPQVPAIQDDTLIRFPNGSTSSYQTLMTALNNTRMQHRNNTDLYNYLTLILDQVKDAQSVSEVERVLTEHKQLSNALLTRGTNGYYFSIDAAGGTRKRRLKRTLRKRSKRTKKARKRK